MNNPRLLSLIFCSLLVLFAAGCGSDGDSSSSKKGGSDKADSSDRYPAAVRKTFVDSCEKSSGGASEGCKAALECFEEKVPYDDFVKADTAVRQGTEAPESYRDAVPACQKAAQG